MAPQWLVIRRSVMTVFDMTGLDLGPRKRVVQARFRCPMQMPTRRRAWISIDGIRRDHKYHTDVGDQMSRLLWRRMGPLRRERLPTGLQRDQLLKLARAGAETVLKAAPGGDCGYRTDVSGAGVAAWTADGSPGHGNGQPAHADDVGRSQEGGLAADDEILH